VVFDTAGAKHSTLWPCGTLADALHCCVGCVESDCLSAVICWQAGGLGHCSPIDNSYDYAPRPISYDEVMAVPVRA